MALLVSSVHLHEINAITVVVSSKNVSESLFKWCMAKGEARQNVSTL